MKAPVGQCWAESVVIMVIIEALGGMGIILFWEMKGMIFRITSIFRSSAPDLCFTEKSFCELKRFVAPTLPFTKGTGC